ncbi:hypothetical protein QCA50_006287 [Cerrena zonata]|uniref:C3H1-type domain-containing protein n=1 Tax=Cerrena zonata TaxID=2478898 RepID=A0AAW0GHC2_9APHY
MNTQRPRTKLCRNYALGNCPQGDRCKYIHSDQIVFSPTYVIGPQSPIGQVYHGSISPTSPFSISSPSMPWTASQRIGPPFHTYPMGWTLQMPPTGQASNATRPSQFRALSWRTTLCRHFVKNQGWCPLGDECGYIHDLRLAEHAQNDIRYPDGRRPRSLGPPKQSHCWAYVQGMCRVGNCPYIHPLAIDLFVPHTPCLSWPNCNKGALCCFKHPEPLIPKLPSFHPEPLPNIPAGTYQALGTTYFPVAQDPNAPTSPSAPVPYSPSARSGFSPYSNASLPFFSPIYEPKRPPFVAPPLVAIASNSSEDANRYIGMPPPIPINDVKIAGDVKVDDASSIGEASTEEFPYRPSTHQRPGHTRRISVTLKSKEDSDALGLSQTRTSRRPSWMTHSKRDAETHRSWPWAPESLGLASSAPHNKTDFGL